MPRNAVIASIKPSMSLSTRGENDPEPEIEGRPWLELRGALIESIQDAAKER